MLAISDTSTTPQGGWKITIGDKRLSAHSYTALLNKAIWEAGRQDLALPLDKEQWFQDLLCRQINTKCEVVAPVTTATRKLNAGDALHFLKVVWKWLASSGAELVPQSEADRRAEICASCPLNIPITGCSVCKGIAGKIFGITKGRKTRWDSQLQGCGVCGCINKLQVFIPLKALEKGVTPEMRFPNFCWKYSLNKTSELPV